MDALNTKIKSILTEKTLKVRPENIKKDVEILGITGTYTSDADATVNDIKTGKTAYVNGSKLTGQFNGVDTSDADATAGNILNNKTAYVNGTKLTGSMPNNGALSYIPSDSSQSIPEGYTSGGIVSATDITALSDYQDCLDIADNILSKDENEVVIYDNGTLSVSEDIYAKTFLGIAYVDFVKTPVIVFTQQGSGSSGSECMFYFGAVDFTNIKTLEITLTDHNVLGNLSYSNDLKIALPTQVANISTNTNIENTLYTSTADINNEVISLDVSSITGQKYIVFRTGCRAFTSKKTVIISKVVLRKEDNAND